MRIPFKNPVSRLTSGTKKERGAALLEFAIALPIFIALLAVVFDAGIGFSSSRSSANAARAGARVGALAGEDRDADFRVLDALRAEYGDGAEVISIKIYLSDDSNPDGSAPGTCDASTNCNEYPGSVLDGLSRADFDNPATTVVVGLDANGDEVLGCAAGTDDEGWCPLNRRQTGSGKFLGVEVESRASATVGLGASGFDLTDRSVFAMYFPPLPATPTPTGP